MCILFAYIAKRITPGEFKLVILNNRDEYHHRASRPAKFINDNNVYGVDMTSGKEGGTWLGCSRLGKIAALLNLDSHDHASDDLNKEGRGFMVPDFLNTKENAFKYVEKLKEKAGKYNPFNLVLFEKSNEHWNASIFNNYECNYKNIDSEFLSISNHLYHRPYPKTVTGQDLFVRIIKDFNNMNRKSELVSKLFNLAKHDAGKKFELDLAESDESYVRNLTRDQVFINIPSYGTRTHTLILVDDKNKVTFNERTMEFPIAQEKPVWVENTYEFDLTDELNKNSKLS